MAARLQERLCSEGFAPVSRAEVMDGQALAAPDAAFDVAFCIFGVMLFPDPPRGLAEMRRVLKPGGRAVVATWADAGGGGPSPLFIDTFRQTFPKAEQPAYPPYLSRWTDLALLQADVEAAGFSSVKVSAWTGLWTLPSVEAARPGMLRFFGRQPAFRRLSPDNRRWWPTRSPSGWRPRATARFRSARRPTSRSAGLDA
jgi:SAM-dependent methyltransferase